MNNNWKITKTLFLKCAHKIILCIKKDCDDNGTYPCGCISAYYACFVNGGKHDVRK